MEKFKYAGHCFNILTFLKISNAFLLVNRFGELRDDNDPNCTYEGDNNMLLWQSSSYLLSLLEAKQKGQLSLQCQQWDLCYINKFLLAGFSCFQLYLLMISSQVG